MDILKYVLVFIAVIILAASIQSCKHQGNIEECKSKGAIFVKTDRNYNGICVKDGKIIP